MKYRQIILKSVLDKNKWKTTFKIKIETEKLANKTINWYSVKQLLMCLFEEGMIEKTESDNIILWRKKENGEYKRTSP